MVIELISSKEFNWEPEIVEADDKNAFFPSYAVSTEATNTPVFFNSKFADLPSSGMWEDLQESDEELLDKIGNSWGGFGGDE